MNNDYCLQSYTNNDQGEGDGAIATTKAGAKATAANWFQKTRIYKVITNPMFIVCLILFIGIVGASHQQAKKLDSEHVG